MKEKSILNKPYSSPVRPQNAVFRHFKRNIYKHNKRKMALGGLKPKNKQKEVSKTMAESLVVKAKIKDAAKGYNVAGDFADALSGAVEKLVKKACERAEANGRKTVMAKDL